MYLLIFLTFFLGWCWPGASYYPDFLKPEAREYFSEQYMLDNYKGSTLDLFTWNDMNEPSVFNGPEVTMPKDLMHVGNVEHREMHNIYGHLYVMGTHAGHLKRSNNELRPFILTRSAFAGTQRYIYICLIFLTFRRIFFNFLPRNSGKTVQN